MANIIEIAKNKITSVDITLRGEDGRPSFVFKDVLTDYAFYIDGAQQYTDDATSFVEKMNVIFTIITNIGMVVAVLMSAFTGVKYMLGSAEEKADYKKDLIPYFVGAILLFGISAIVKAMLQIGQTINNS